MRVVHFSRGFEDYVITLANGLAEIADVHLVIASSDEWIQRELSARVHTYCSGAPRVSNLRNVSSTILTARHVRQLKPDVIHFQNGVAWEGFVPLFNSGAPVVTTIHDVTMHPINSFWSMRTPQAILDVMPKRSNGVILHGARLAAEAQVRFDFNAKRTLVRCIPHPVITRYGTGSASPQAKGNILFFGNLERYKGVEVLLRAMPQVVGAISNVTLRVAGRATNPDYYRNLTPAGARVEWDLRYQTDSDVRAAFSWADVVVLPYIEASQSGVLYLAASFGVPVVATRVGSLPDAIVDGTNGVLADAGDPDSLGQAIIRVLTDSELRSRLIAAVVEDRTRSITNNSVATATTAFYREVIDQSRRFT